MGMRFMAAVAQAAEALGLVVVIVLNVIDSASGNTWTASNAIAQIVFEAVVAAGVAWIALGIARARPWSRTPAVLTQVFTGMIAIWLPYATTAKERGARHSESFRPRLCRERIP